MGSVMMLSDTSRNGPLPFPNREFVNKQIESMTGKDANNEDASWKTCGLDRALKFGKPDVNIWTPKLLARIDKVAKSAFSKCPMEIGLRSTSYKKALETYKAGVISAIEEELEGDRRLDEIVNRCLWVLTARPTNTSPPMPIMTEWVIKTLVETLNRISNGISEVSKQSESAGR